MIIYKKTSNHSLNNFNILYFDELFNFFFVTVKQNMNSHANISLLEDEEFSFFFWAEVERKKGERFNLQRKARIIPK